MTVFVMQGMANGLLGAISGAIIGGYLAQHLTAFFSTIEGLLNIEFLSGDVYFVDYLPTAVYASDIYLTAGVAIIMSIIATLYPAWQATKIEPAQVLGQL